MLLTRMKTLPFLLLTLSPFIMSPPPKWGWGHIVFGTDPLGRQHKTSCPFCNLNTLWNISMILGRNVDQEERTCCIQD